MSLLQLEMDFRVDYILEGVVDIELFDLPYVGGFGWAIPNSSLPAMLVADNNDLVSVTSKLSRLTSS